MRKRPARFHLPRSMSTYSELRGRALGGTGVVHADSSVSQQEEFKYEGRAQEDPNRGEDEDRHFYGDWSKHKKAKEEQEAKEERGSYQEWTYEREDQGEVVECKICGKFIDRSRVVKRAGWEVCNDHKCFIKPSKFDSHCTACLGSIGKGDLCLLVREFNTWLAFHPHGQCGVAELRDGDVPSGPYAVLHLLPSAPVEVVKAAYKAMAMMHHPDKGGDTSKMKEINDAISQIIKPQ